MNLWVRSQNKSGLYKVDEVYIIERETYKSNCFKIISRDYLLGTYETKERALEVLDEIHKLLIPKPIISTYNVEQVELLDGKTFIKPMLDDIKMESYTSYVYQMPEK